MNNVNNTSSNMLTGFSTTTRITGLSGFDTDSMVKQLMQAEKIPLNSLMQKRTLLQWRQDAYRDVTNSLKGFKSSFFDVVNPASYVLSKNAIKAVSATSGNNAYLSVSASSDANLGSQTVKVLQVASGAGATTTGRASQDIIGNISAAAIDSAVPAGLDLSGQSVSVTLDGVTKQIALDKYTSSADLVTKLGSAVDTAFGSGKVSIQFVNDKLSIGTSGGATTISVGDPGTGTSGLAGLGLIKGESNRVSLNSTLGDLEGKLAGDLNFNGSDQVQFTINGKLIEAKKTDTLSEVLDKINNTPEANVTVKYDSLTDKFTIASKQPGAGNNLTMEDIGSSFLTSIGLIGTNSTTVNGQDAKILINGTQTVTRSANNFTVNGVTYDLKAQHPADSAGDTISVQHDVDKAYNNIKTYIDKYNELLDKLNGKIGEHFDRDYPPLTDDQKSSMSAADITNWETKAKTGLLQNDSVLQKIADSMRQAMYEPVTGTGLTLKSIGISSSSYLDQGKLTIDENTLKDALRNNPDEVAKLLNGVDPDNPTYSRTADSGQMASRYAKSGLFQRISDIVEDNISTYRDSNGNKGILLVKAGIPDDITDAENQMTDELNDYDERISTMKDQLKTKEDNYYRKFSQLETYLAQMNQQSAWLTSQFSANQ